MTIGRDGLSKAETITIAVIEGGVPLLVEAREIIVAFRATARTTSLTDLGRWLEHARSSLVASFANGVINDQPTTWTLQAIIDDYLKRSGFTRRAEHKIDDLETAISFVASSKAAPPSSAEGGEAP